MSTTFSNALAGLKANALAIDTVSNNLANLNTVGYMDNDVAFDDLLNGSSNTATSGGVAGSVVANVTTQFSQGSIQNTNQPFDAAIQGSGFFVLNGTNNQQVFTRAGNFTVDSSGNLLGAGGKSVLGWNAVNGVVTTTAAASPINLPVSGSQPPKATANFYISANLNANAAVGTADATFSSPIQVFDSQGQAHTLTVTYTESAPGSWGYTVSVPSADVTGGQGTSTTVATGTLTFNAAGQLTSPAASAGPVAVSVTGLADGAADMTVNWNLYNSEGASTITQYSGSSANLASRQDGTAPGQLTGTSIGADGKISASYSNGSSVVVAQIAIASILNPDSMKSLGDNTFAASSATATPIIGASGTGSRGHITGGALESSTVDIAKEFTNLLTYERGYQANSKVITTEDNITQSTVGLIQA